MSPIPEFTSLPSMEKKSFESKEESPGIIEDVINNEENVESKDMQPKEEDDEMTLNEKVQINRESSIDSLESNYYKTVNISKWLMQFIF